ncbi:NB-ARC domain-containing protein [Puniceibacterium antarcticum]|uniref:NB-ARC domain-containing protein n=1 Tax=Puniceibacterium antarcticum TaxID=1206336 RepID=UPI0011799F2D|nr:NB-ARC domain-containing protein [Puniceibacterium antarcticum]
MIADPIFPEGRLFGRAWSKSKKAIDVIEPLLTVGAGMIDSSHTIRLKYEAAGLSPTLKGHSGFPVFDRLGNIAALHRGVDDWAEYDLLAISAKALRLAFHEYAKQKGMSAESLEVFATPVPLDAVERPMELEQAVAAILGAERVTALTSLHGDGGYGKSTLAEMIRNDLRIREHFGARSKWITIGQNPADLAQRFMDLALELDPKSAPAGTVDGAASRLKDALAGAPTFVVVDDLWREEHLKPFMNAGRNLSVLVTTRNQALLPKAAAIIKVEEMAPADAYSLISRGLPVTTDQERAALERLADTLWNWAQLLDIVRRWMGARLAEGTSLIGAIDAVKRRFLAYGVTAFDPSDQRLNREDPAERQKAIDVTFAIGVEDLSDVAKGLYQKLAAFPRGAVVSTAVIEAYWRKVGAKQSLDATDLLHRLEARRLVRSGGPGQKGYWLHDNAFDWLARQTDDIARLHDVLADVLAYQRENGRKAAATFAWEHEVATLRLAGRATEADDRMTSYPWVKGKLAALIADHLGLPPETPENVWVVGDTLKLAGASLAKSPEHLPYYISSSLRSRAPSHPMVTMAEADPGLWPRSVRHELNLQRLEVLRFVGHDDDVNTAAFSPDGAWAITASFDDTARIWRVADGAAGPVLRGHEGGVRTGAFSPDGAWAITVSDDTARLWRVADGAAGPVLRGHEGSVRTAAFSPDGALAITASRDDTARIWRVADGAAGPVLRGHEGEVSTAAFSPDRAWAITASVDGTARLWWIADGAAGPVLRGHQARVRTAAFSPDGAWVITASNDCTARLWRVVDGGAGPVLRGHENWVNTAEFSPDGAWAITASNDRTARLWRVADGAAGPVLRGHEKMVDTAAFSPDGALVITASRDRTARLWRVTDGAAGPVMRGHEKMVKTAAFCPDGSLAITASDDRTARLWRVAGGAAGPVMRGHEGEVSTAAFSPDGAWAITASDDRTARLWSVAGGAAGPVLRGHEGAVYSAAFSPDGASAITASDDDTARLWRAADGAAGPVLRGHEGWVRTAAFSPDGAWALLMRPRGSGGWRMARRGRCCAGMRAG